MPHGEAWTGSSPSSEKRPRVVIIGAGFGGLACARALGNKPVDVTVIDRRNFHLFVPLLYQVATAALSPADIAQPIRRILSRYKNIEVMMAEAVGVDTSGARGAAQETAPASPTTVSSSRPARNTIISATTTGRASRRD